jgi:hypothetical protein
MNIDKIVIDPEFASLLTPLTAEESEQLEANLTSAGVICDPLVVWHNILLDGHNRLKIIKKHGLKYDVKELDDALPDRSAAMAWMIEHQFGRRNVSPGARAVAEASVIQLRISSEIKELPLATVAKSKPHTTTRRATYVAKYSPTRARKVMAGKMSLEDAEKKTRDERIAEGREKRREAPKPRVPDHGEVINRIAAQIATLVTDLKEFKPYREAVRKSPSTKFLLKSLNALNDVVTYLTTK